MMKGEKNMLFFWTVVIGLVLNVICEVMKSRKPAIIVGLICIVVGFGMILGDNITGWHFLIVGVGSIYTLGRGEDFSIRKESRKYAPVLYVISIVLMIVGKACWDELFAAGMILLIGTAGIRFLDCITSPIKIHIKKHDE